jgi:nucleolar protein 53
MYKKQIVKTEGEIEKRKVTRAVKQDLKNYEPRRLTRKFFEEEDVQVEASVEALGNLRKIQPLGSILVDRFKSMQKRNILLPNIKRQKRSRRLTKIKKHSHKEEVVQPMTKKMRKSNKLQIHD